VRERREPPPAAGQFPGVPGTHAGAAHLSDQHRARLAVDAGRARLRVRPHLRHGRAAGAYVLDAGGAGALRGPRPQLVRHDQPGRPAAAVRVHGRYGQPGGISPEPGGRPSPPTTAPDAALAARLEDLAQRCEVLVNEMDFSFLFDTQRKIFAIGYRLADAEGPGRLDPSFYDLLASEARLASFIAIAKGDVPQ